MTGPLRLLVNGQQYFKSLASDIDQAEHQVYLETYLLSRDAETEPVLAALDRAASRGVSVLLVVDGFGGRKGLEALEERWSRSGIRWQVFAPGVRVFSPRTWRRLHRKLVLIDHRLVYVGGINLIGDHVDLNHGPLESPRFDLAVRTSHESVVNQVRRLAQSTWWRLSWSALMHGRADANELRMLWRRLRPFLRRPLERPIAAGRRPIRLLLRDNIRHRHDIERAYYRALSEARHEVLMAMAYFLPTRPLRKRLCNLARRGIRVRLLLQGRVEYWWAHWAQQALVEELVEAGVEVYEYRRSFLHAKVLCVDDWVTIGSSNVDPFSLMLSLEANLAIEQPAFAQDVLEVLTREIETGADRLQPESQRQGPQAWWLFWARRPLLALALLGLRFFVMLSRRATPRG